MRAILILCMVAWAGGVTLANAQGMLGPGPYTPQQEQVQKCIDLTSAASRSCTAESDTLSLTYPRDSTKLPTNDQIINGLSRLRAAALPSAGCCAGLAPYVAANCPCLPGYQQLLPIGGFAPAYFEGATYILALACHLDFPLCHNAPIPEQKSG